MRFVVVLHDVRSVHNVGSVFRTADAAGFEKIFLCGITPTPMDRFGKLRPDFAKVALGAEKNVAWEFSGGVEPLIEKLKDSGWKIVALEQAKRAIPYYEFHEKHKAERLALIVGNEVDGVPSEILKITDAIIQIPMLGKKESLNVSVAFGIAAYHLRFS